jgi:hypothetical protein
MKLAAHILETPGVPISPAVVSAAESSDVSRTRHRLAFPDEHAEKRIRVSHPHGSIDWRGDVVLWDESHFSHSDEGRCRRPHGERGVHKPKTFRDKVKYSESLLVWGGIAFDPGGDCGSG